ncbi:MAG: hypothetical protein GX444_17780 [Myxococcales bacterium]|nr:hypothetical protein [Myxococcales bacterium]
MKRLFIIGVLLCLLFPGAACLRCAGGDDHPNDDDNEASDNPSPTPWPTDDDDTNDDDTHDDDSWFDDDTYSHPTWIYPVGETSIGSLPGTLAIAFPLKSDGNYVDTAEMAIYYLTAEGQWQDSLWGHAGLSGYFNDLIGFDELSFVLVFDGDSESGVAVGKDTQWTDRPSIEGVSGPVAIARDGAGAIHVARIRLPDDLAAAGYEQAEYSVQTATGWDTTELIPVASQYPNTPGDDGVSLAIDHADCSHLVLWSGYNLFYFRRESGVWSDPEIVTFEALPRAFSVGVNSLDVPYLVYCTLGKKVAIVFREAEEWNEQTLPGNCTGARNDLVIDENDVLHLAYRDYGWNVTYATMSLDDFSTWQSEFVEAGSRFNRKGEPFSGENVSLALDENGFVHLTYRDYIMIRYATNQTGSFSAETVYYGDQPDDDAAE